MPQEPSLPTFPAQPPAPKTFRRVIQNNTVILRERVPYFIPVPVPVQPPKPALTPGQAVTVGVIGGSILTAFLFVVFGGRSRR